MLWFPVHILTVEYRGQLRQSAAAAHYAQKCCRHFVENANVTDLLSNVRRFLIDEDGTTAIEYALMLALIVIVAFAGLRSLRLFMPGKFSQVANSLNNYNQWQLVY